MELVDTVGGLIVTIGLLFAFAYAIRHRGRICNWLNNFDHDGNKPEKETEVTRLKRRIEDANADLMKLEK